MKNPMQAISAIKPLCRGVALALGAGLASPAPLFAADALSESSTLSDIAPQSLLLDLDRAGEQLVAVGERGHILLSDNAGTDWQQVETPVRVTLTAAHFVDEQFGWAVGHDGVILHTQDGGRSWTKQLDGYEANQLMLERTQKLLADTERALENASEEDAEALEFLLGDISYLVDDAQIFIEEGPSRPLLGVWFKDRNEGIAVGAFGLILRTADGGETWTGWVDHIHNPLGYHLNNINQVGDRLFITAEAGTLYRSSDWGQSWVQLDSPYEGSFFGTIGNAQGRVIAYGLRGNAFQSNDWGERWQPIATGTDAGLFGGTLLDDGTLVLVGDAGVSVFFDPQGQRIGLHQTARRLPLSTAIADGDAGLLTVGLSGIQTSPLAGGSD